MQANPILSAIRAATVPLVSVLLGLAVASIVIALTGRSVEAALVALFRGALVGRNNIELTILNAIPLVFTGLSIAIAFRAGLFNIGAEGQVMVGGIVATWLGATLALGPVWTPLASLAGSAAAGAAWAYPAAWLKVRRGAHEVITTLMLSYIAFYLTTYARRYPLFDKSSTTQSSISVLPEARLPLLNQLAPFLDWERTRLHAGLFLAILAVAAGWVFLYRTVWGYEIRAIGSNPAAAAANGIGVQRTIVVTLCVAGAVAGLGGGVQLLGLYHKISTDSFIGLGFAGFFIALMARSEPLAVIPAALFFGALRAGGLNMQFAADVPFNLVELLQGLVIMIMATPALLGVLRPSGRR